MDSWNPKTFDAELCEVLTDYSDLITEYYHEAQRLMDEHRSSVPYESLKPNQYYADYLTLCERTVTPLLSDRRIRVWHYTRLLDDEVSSIQRKLEPSTLASLKQRLEMLTKQGLLTLEEAEIVYSQSPFQTQDELRSNRVCTVTVPLHPNDHSVELLLESWGGESAYFWLTNKSVAEKLKNIGTPRIVEIETALRDKLNAFSVAETVIQAWAINLGFCVEGLGRDLTIMGCMDTAQVLRVHTAGDGVFEKIGKTYPNGCDKLLGKCDVGT